MLWRTVGVTATSILVVGMTCEMSQAGDLTHRPGFRILHSFGNAPGDGWQPWGSPTLVNGELIGRATYGGTNDQASVIWRMNPNSPASYRIAHNFGANSVEYRGGSFGRDVTNPHHDWLRPSPDGNYLFGAALWGSDGGQGGVYRIGLDDSYRLLHGFGGRSSNNPSGSTADGAQPHSNAVPIVNPRSGETELFGLTAAGGKKGEGTLYQMRMDGSGFHLLHSFRMKSGNVPHGFVVRSGNWLYGLTRLGAVVPKKENFTSKANYKLYKKGDGVLWRYNLLSGTYRVMHRFSYAGPLAAATLPGGAVDGAVPDHGGLQIRGNRLWGVTTLGGRNQGGVIFSIRMNGSDYRIAHTFGSIGRGADLARPHGTLMPGPDGWLYALADQGGKSGVGGVFRYQPSSRRYQVLYSFKGGQSASTGIDNPVVTQTAPHQITVYGMSQLGGRVRSNPNPVPPAPDYKPAPSPFANGTIWRLVFDQ